MATRKPQAPFSVTLDGAGKLEDVPLREVAAWLDGLVGLVARGSALVLHRPIPPGGGRYEGPVELASQIRLESLTSGSIVANLLPAKPGPPPEGSLGLSVDSLSEQGMSLLIDVAGGQIEKAPELAKSLAAFVDRFVARHEGATLRLVDHRPDRSREVVLSPGKRAEIRDDLVREEPSEIATKVVAGRLYEVNTETHSALLRVPSGSKVDVKWSPEQQVQIRQLLGGHADLLGEVEVDSKTNEIKSVRIREIVSGAQLGLDFAGVNFWTDVPATDLALMADAMPVEDPTDLEVSGVTESEWSALYEALGSGR